MTTLPGLTITAPPAADEGGTFRFVVDRTINTAPACSVSWRQGGTCTPNDFAVGTPLSGTVEFASGQSQAFIDFLVSDDADIEPDETLTVELGDPVGCVLLQQPVGGTVVVNDDQTITYTPKAGFTGTDVIPYIAKNSDGQLANSTITVTVEAPTVPHFVNNYRVKIEAFVAPDTEAMTGFELLFDITDPQLRTEANGGVAVDSAGRDIRLEDGAGATVPYARLRYNPMSGRVVGIAKRDRATPTTWNNLEIYAGKVGTIVEEAQPSTALANLLACWRMDTGIDISGHGPGRDLTLSSTAINTSPLTTVFEEPAGNFDRTLNQQASLSDPSTWLNGLTAFSLMMDLVVDTVVADSGVFRTGGSTTVATDIDSACTIGVRPDTLSFYATPQVSNLWFSIVKIGATLCRVESPGNSLKVGTPTTFSVAWATGQAITHVVDDVVLTPVYNEVAAPAGALSVPGGPLVIAGGPRGNADGKIGLVRIAGTRRSNAWLKAEQRNRLYPRKLLAFGPSVGPNDTAAPVAFPDTATATGPDKSIPMPTLNTGTSIKLVAATTEQAGSTITIVNTPTVGASLLYRQASGFAGVDHITYTIEDFLGRQSSSIIAVTVSGTPLVLGTDGPYDVTGTAVLPMDVQANDTGTGRHITAVTNDTARATIATVGSGATATLTYTSIVPFFGADSFTYEVTDGAGQIRTSAPITVNVLLPAITAGAIVAAAITAGDTAGRLISPLTASGTSGVGLTLPSQTFTMTPAQGSAALSGTTQIKYTPPATIDIATEVSFIYTIKDAYNQTTQGTIKITVNPVAAVVASASADAYTATSGQSLNPLPTSPLANDTLNGVINDAALTIQALPAGVNGSGGGTFTRVSGNKNLNYTPPTVTTVTTDSIDYTITDSATPTAHTDVGTITVTVNPVVDAARPKAPPAIPANSPLIVGPLTTSDQLRTALTNASAGQHIRLAATTFTGDFKLDKAIAQANPVVIEGPAMAANSASPGAILTGQWVASGTGYWLHQLTFNNSSSTGRQLAITGSYITVTRCWFRDNTAGSISNQADTGRCIFFEKAGGGSHSKIGYCRFTKRCGRNHIMIQLPEPSQLSATNHPHHSAIYRNYFWDNMLAKTAKGEDQENHIIYFGDSHPHKYGEQLCMDEVYVEENFVDVSLRKRQFYLKRGCFLIRNRVRADHGEFGFRHGGGGRIWGNRCEGGADFMISGPNVDCRKNVWSGGALINCGNIHEGTSGNLIPHQACDGSLFVGNSGTLLMGFKYGSQSLSPPHDRPDNDMDDPTTANPDGFAGGKLSGVHVWEHVGQPGTIDTSKYSPNIASGGVTNHGATTYTADNLSSTFSTVPAGWDGDDTGFETGPQGV